MSSHNIFLTKCQEEEGKKVIHLLWQWKKSATTAPETAAAVASKKETKTSEDKESLIDSCLATPPWQNHDDNKATDSKEMTEKQIW